MKHHGKQWDTRCFQSEKMNAIGFSGALHEKIGVHYIGFKINDPSVLESMKKMFDSIKEEIWPNEEQNSNVRRVKFNENFKYLNLCIETMRALQKEVMACFEEFPNPDLTRPYNIDCCLLSLNTAATFENVKKVVSKCFSEVGSLEVPLGPFMLSCYRRVLRQYPQLPRAVPNIADDVPAWVSRSLCVFGFPRVDAAEIFRAIARWSAFDFKANALERCYWDTEYYGSPRIVVVFEDTPVLRDEFYKNFISRLSICGGEVFADDFDTQLSHVKIGVYKAMPAERESIFVSAKICCRDLKNLYRARVDENRDFHLQQLRAPYRKHYFNTKDELEELIHLLKHDSTTEYLTSIW